MQLLKVYDIGHEVMHKHVNTSS